MDTPICPRCGGTTIEVKDWGRAGKLYVHRWTEEQGIPVKVACQLTADEVASGPAWTLPKPV